MPTITVQSSANAQRANSASVAASLVFATSLGCGTPLVLAADDAGAGKKIFEQQCVACHTAEPNDNGGVQGPSLIGVFGRPVGTDKEFSYTAELRDSKLVWDAQTLDRFLAAPDKVVPGTAMVMAVPNQADRQHLIAYLQQAVASASRP
jgi:cytochrome c